MDSELILEILAILVLVLANGFFALAEFSIIASRSSKLQQKVDEGKPGARTASRIKQKPERFLATIQVGITLVATLIGILSGITIVKEFESLLKNVPIPTIANAATPIAVALMTIFITMMSVVLGELVPKYLALSYPERYARYVARPIAAFIKVTSLFARLLSGMANMVLKLMGVRQDHMQRIISEDEINQMIVEGKDKGVFDETEEEFVRSVFEFADSTVRRAMTPRPDVIGFEVNASSDEILKAINENGYSRYPVFEKSIDNVIGILYIKDFLVKAIDFNSLTLSDVTREPYYVPDSMPLAKLLREFQKGRNHLAVVLDEFGGTAGIITIEDILEELVGEIQDEYDVDEETPLVKHSDTVAYADGAVWPGEINEIFHSNLPEDNADTLAGLFIDTIGRFPKKNESIRIADIKMTVLVQDRNRIVRMKVEKIPHETDDGR